MPCLFLKKSVEKKGKTGQKWHWWNEETKIVQKIKVWSDLIRFWRRKREGIAEQEDDDIPEEGRVSDRNPLCLLHVCLLVRRYRLQGFFFWSHEKNNWSDSVGKNNCRVERSLLTRGSHRHWTVRLTRMLSRVDCRDALVVSTCRVCSLECMHVSRSKRRRP